MKRPFRPLLLIVMKTPTSPEVIVVSHSRKTTGFCLFGILLKVGTWITWQLELGVFFGSYLSLTSPFVAPRGRSLAARTPRNSRFEE